MKPWIGFWVDDLYRLRAITLANPAPAGEPTCLTRAQAYRASTERMLERHLDEMRRTRNNSPTWDDKQGGEL